MTRNSTHLYCYFCISYSHGSRKIDPKASFQILMREHYGENIRFMDDQLNTFAFLRIPKKEIYSYLHNGMEALIHKDECKRPVDIVRWSIVNMLSDHALDLKTLFIADIGTDWMLFRRTPATDPVPVSELFPESS